MYCEHIDFIVARLYWQKILFPAYTDLKLSAFLRDPLFVSKQERCEIALVASTLYGEEIDLSISFYVRKKKGKQEKFV